VEQPSDARTAERGERTECKTSNRSRHGPNIRRAVRTVHARLRGFCS
jgi:hypothetical protein